MWLYNGIIESPHPPVPLKNSYHATSIGFQSQIIQRDTETLDNDFVTRVCCVSEVSHFTVAFMDGVFPKVWTTCWLSGSFAPGIQHFGRLVRQACQSQLTPPLCWYLLRFNMTETLVNPHMTATVCSVGHWVVLWAKASNSGVENMSCYHMIIGPQVEDFICPFY